jgi:predicted transcriptional regulator
MNSTNSLLIATLLKCLYNVTSRRTTSKFAEDTIQEALMLLKQNYDFLSQIKIESHSLTDKELDINLSSSIENVPKTQIGGAIECLIRVICSDIGKDVGLYFITEIKQLLKPSDFSHLKDLGVDLNKIQIEQQIAYQKFNKTQGAEKGPKENPLGYTWSAVKKWEHQQGSKYVTLYDKNDNVIDQIDLEIAIKSYVEELSGIRETDPTELENLIKKYEKEYSLLKLIYEDNIDMDTAQKILKLTNEEVQNIIMRLIDMQILKSDSEDTVIITETGKNFLKKEKST